MFTWSQADAWGLGLAIALGGTAIWGLWYFGKVEGVHGWRAVIAGWKCLVAGVVLRLQEWAFQFRLRQLDRRLTNAETLADLREAFGELGMPLDHLTDDELRAGAMQLGETLYAAGLTVDEAAASLEQVAGAMREQGGAPR